MRIEPVPSDATDESARAIFEQAIATCRWLPNTIRVMARGQSADHLYMTILQLAAAVPDTAGHVADSDLEVARHAGLDDGVLIEIVSVVAENILGNYINNLARTTVDELLTRAVIKLLADQPHAEPCYAVGRGDARIADGPAVPVSQ